MAVQTLTQAPAHTSQRRPRQDPPLQVGQGRRARGEILQAPRCRSLLCRDYTWVMLAGGVAPVSAPVSFIWRLLISAPSGETSRAFSPSQLCTPPEPLLTHPPKLPLPRPPAPSALLNPMVSPPSSPHWPLSGHPLPTCHTALSTLVLRCEREGRGLQSPLPTPTAQVPPHT